MFKAEKGFYCVGVSKDEQYVVAGGGDYKVYFRDTRKVKKVEDDDKTNAGKEKEGEGEDDKAKVDGDVKRLKVEKGYSVCSLVFGKEKGDNGGGGNVVYVSTSSGKVCEIDLTSGEVTRTFKGHTREIYGITLSPDGKTLIIGMYESTARVWGLTADAAEGGEVRVKVIK